MAESIECLFASDPALQFTKIKSELEAIQVRLPIQYSKSRLHMMGAKLTGAITTVKDNKTTLWLCTSGLPLMRGTLWVQVALP